MSASAARDETIGACRPSPGLAALRDERCLRTTVSPGAAMNPRPPVDAPAPAPETPESMLDRFRAHPEWTDRERDAQFDRLVALFPRERLLEAVRPRMHDLQAGD